MSRANSGTSGNITSDESVLRGRVQGIHPVTAEADPHRVECALFDLYCTLVDVQIDEDTPALWAGLSEALGATRAFADPFAMMMPIVAAARLQCSIRLRAQLQQLY